jgi:hypothetical protein
MTQLAALEQLGIDTEVGVRPYAIACVETTADVVSVRCFSRKITFPPHTAAAVQFALNCERFVVKDLPGDLDASGKVTLVRRLIREGLLEARST